MANIRRSITAAALTCVALGTTAAQSIRGSVESAGQPVVGAMVRVLELDRAQRTDARGEYSFPSVPIGAYTLSVSAFGFVDTSARVNVSSGVATVSIDLRPTAVTLHPVVVSASPNPRPANEAYQSVDSKSEVDFLNSTGTSFAEKLSDLPGVTVRGNGSAPSRPILRGLTDNEVLVVENGLRMGDIATYDPAHATPLDAVGIVRVDVIRGPSAILYGPNTLGGLVNVITDIVPSVSNHAASGLVNLEANSVNSGYSGFARSVWSSQSSALSVSGGTLRAHDIAIPAGTYTDPVSGASFHLADLPQTDQHSDEAGAGFVHQGTFGEWGIGAKHYESNYGVPGVPPNADWIDVPPTTSRISQQRNTVEFRSLLLPDTRVIDRVKLDANYNDYTHSEFPTAEDSTGVSDPQANHFHKREFNGTLQFQQRQRGSLDGVIGLWADVQDLTIEGDQPLGPNSRTTDLAGYAYEELRPSPATSVSAAARFDYNGIQTRPFLGSTDSAFQAINASRTTNAVTASLGAVDKLTSSLTASANVARSFRAPTVQELFANGLDAASGTYSVGTSSLGPESGVGLDASLRGEFAAVEFELSPYANYINHFIYGFLRGDTIQDFPVRQFAATDARLIGFEASVILHPWDRFAIRASSDYVNAEDTEHDMPLPFTPPLRGLLRGTYDNQNWMAMAEWRMAAAQNRLGIGDTPTSGYGILNVGYGVRYASRGMVHTISLHCDNVFNRVYRDNLSVVKDFLPQPARGIRLNYELTY